MEQENEKRCQPINNFYGKINNYTVYQSPVTITYEGPVNNYDGETEEETPTYCTDAEERIKTAINILQNEGTLKHLYDYAWLMQAMNDTTDLPHFDTPQSFLNYMQIIGIQDLPEVSSVKKAYGKVVGTFPEWTFLDADATECNRRVNVGRRFMSAYRKGD